MLWNLSATAAGAACFASRACALRRLRFSRSAARKAKNFAEADRIRDDLLAQGITLEDGPGGTIWRRAH